MLALFLRCLRFTDKIWFSLCFIFLYRQLEYGNERVIFGVIFDSKAGNKYKMNSLDPIIKMNKADLYIIFNYILHQ